MKKLSRFGEHENHTFQEKCNANFGLISCCCFFFFFFLEFSVLCFSETKNFQCCLSTSQKSFCSCQFLLRYQKFIGEVRTAESVMKLWSKTFRVQTHWHRQKYTEYRVGEYDDLSVTHLWFVNVMSVTSLQLSTCKESCNVPTNLILFRLKWN